MRDKNNIVSIVLVLCGLAVAPFLVANDYYLNILTQVLFFSIYAFGINILVGMGGLITLGSASIFGFSAYAVAILSNLGYGAFFSITGSLVLTLLFDMVFTAISLRSIGVGFMMITLALGQIVWGLAYRWVSLTNGDNGINLSERPSIFDFSLDSATHFYYLSLLLFALTVINIYLFKHSSLGKSLVGTKVQARRMYAMGYDVWKIRFFSCLYAGLFTSVAGILFFYFNQFISPHALSISASTEALLMIISGGTSAIFGPLVGAALIITIKLIVSAFMDRWNLLLGLTFIFIVILMPNGILPFMQQKFSRNRH